MVAINSSGCPGAAAFDLKRVFCAPDGFAEAVGFDLPRQTARRLAYRLGGCSARSG